jgi:hypothetical protein
MNGYFAVCVCEQLCTSKPGLTLHQRNCVKAKEAIARGELGIINSGAMEIGPIYAKEIQEIVELVKDLALDAHCALTEKNKSAGRRARTSLLQLKAKVTPLRKLILKKIK